MNSKNNKGPSTEPWGTPLYTSWKSELRVPLKKYHLLTIFQVAWKPVKFVTCYPVHF